MDALETLAGDSGGGFPEGEDTRHGCGAAVALLTVLAVRYVINVLGVG